MKADERERRRRAKTQRQKRNRRKNVIADAESRLLGGGPQGQHLAFGVESGALMFHDGVDWRSVPGN